MRELVKALARAAATVRVLPTLVWYFIQAIAFSEDLALERATQKLSLAPGIGGDYMRRAFLMRALAFCDRTATVQFGTIFSQQGARLDANVYVGPRCHLGLVHLERDVLLADGVHIPSVAATHGTTDPDRPIREQPGRRSLVRIGEGTWIGSAAVVLADVGRHSVVGAGSVVTTPLPDYVVAAGVPARVIRSRKAQAAGA